nr:IS3 family transposase [Leisingera sp. JC1]
MRRIDEQFLETPFFGVRQMTWHLRNEGHLVNEKRIRRLMRVMGLMRVGSTNSSWKRRSSVCGR